MLGDMAGMMKQAQKMQEQMQKVQEELKVAEVVGNAGADLVSIVMTGSYEAKCVKIDESVLNDKEMLEDLIVAAINDASHKINDKNAQAMRNLTGGINLPPGLKMPF